MSRRARRSCAAQPVFLRVLRLPFLGLGHEDRAGLALALYYRYATSPPEPIIKQAHALLPESRIHRVQTIGLALRLAYALSAGAPGVLKKTSLKIASGCLVLTVPESDPLFKSGSYSRRVKRIADHLGVEAKVEQV